MPGKFNPPDAGDAPQEVKDILAAVYSKLRQEWVNAHPNDMENESNKTSSAKQAWGAVHAAGWMKDAAGKWVKREKANMTACQLLAAVGDPSSDDYGYEWDIQIIKYGLGVDGRINWPRKILAASLPAFDNAKVFALGISQHLPDSGQYGKSVRDIVGWTSNPVDTGTGINARLHILKTAKWLRDGVLDSVARGKPDLFGFSIHVTGGKAGKKYQGGKQIVEPLAISKVEVDVVHDPTNEGKFLKMVAARMTIEGDQKEATMKLKLLAALKTQRPDLKASIEALEAKGDAITEDEVLNLTASAMAAPAKTGTGGGGEGVIEIMTKLLASIDSRAQDQVKDLISKTTKKFDDAEKLLACATLLVTDLQASGLIDVSRERVKKQFEGQIFEPAQLTAAIKAEKEYVDKLTGSGAIDGMGMRASVLTGHPENSAALLADFFKGKNNQHSIKAAYIMITGDTRVTGRIQDAHRLKASIQTTTFDQIFADVAQKQMIEDYSAIGMDDWRKIVKVVPLSDFKTVHRIRKGGYGNLPVVTEGSDYLALATPTDEEQSYAPSKKGGTEDLTLEAIKNDDAGGVRDIPMNLALAAKTTLYEFVFNDLFASNPTMGYDTTALFHADHGNLGAVALDATNLTARRQAMAKQSRLYNGKRLNVRARYGLVPVDLDKTLFDLIAKPGDFTPTAADYTRTFGLEPIVVTCWTDATNWGLVADPRFCPTIEIGFVDGNEEPQIFVQDMPNAGSMFNADKLTYKIKHPYGGVNLDHRGVDYSVVAG